MPELAEVHFYAQQWAPGLGQTVQRVHVHASARVFRETSAAAYAEALVGKTYLAAETHGKNMLYRFGKSRGPQAWLGGHLGMTGELLCMPLEHTPQKHDHLVLYLKKCALVFRDPRKFGALRLHVDAEPPTWWTNLPPKILSEDYTVEFIQAFLLRHPKAPLKPLLLDQQGFPGVGNWMADEILWRLRWHPTCTAASRVPMKAAAKALHRTVLEVTQQAMDVIGATWADPPDSWLFNHRWKDGGNCPRCEKPLERTTIRARTACWCPKCQKPNGTK